MMRNVLILISSIFILVACNESPKKSTNISTSKIEQDKETLPTKNRDIFEYPDGCYPGLVTTYHGKDEVDKIAIEQVNLYYDYLMSGDNNKVINLIYPDVFKYIHQQVPEYSETQVKEEMSRMLSRGTKIMIDQICKSYPQFDHAVVAIKGINRRTISENTIFLNLDLVIQFKGEEQAMYIEDPTIAISLDGGNKWFFMTLSEDTEQILSYKFNKTTVNKVLGYK